MLASSTNCPFWKYFSVLILIFLCVASTLSFYKSLPQYFTSSVSSMLVLGNCLNNISLTLIEFKSDHLYWKVTANVIQLPLKASSQLHKVTIQYWITDLCNAVPDVYLYGWLPLVWKIKYNEYCATRACSAWLIEQSTAPDYMMLMKLYSSLDAAVLSFCVVLCFR